MRLAQPDLSQAGSLPHFAAVDEAGQLFVFLAIFCTGSKGSPILALISEKGKTFLSCFNAKCSPLVSSLDLW